MVANEIIQKGGWFNSLEFSSISVNYGFETIQNLFQTIKEYRSYYDPNAENWLDYTHEFFHLFGFSLQKAEQRLTLLQGMGEQKNYGVALTLSVDEPFEQLINGMDWSAVLFFVSKIYGVEWGILTNGQRLKIYKFAANFNAEDCCEFGLDEIIAGNYIDSFFTLYKSMRVIQLGNSVSVIKPKQLSERKLGTRHHLRKEFWTQLLKLAKTKTNLHANISPGNENWVSASAGVYGVGFNYVILMNGSRLDLYIDHGDQSWNKNFFNRIYAYKEKIEQDFGDQMVWDNEQEKRASVIRYQLPGYGLRDEEYWPEIQETMVEAMIRFHHVLQPYVDQMK